MEIIALVGSALAGVAGANHIADSNNVYSNNPKNLIRKIEPGSAREREVLDNYFDDWREDIENLKDKSPEKLSALKRRIDLDVEEGLLYEEDYQELCQQLESLLDREEEVQQVEVTTPEKLGSEFRVNSCVTNDQTSPAIASLKDGGFVITWQSNGQDGSGNGVYAQRYDSAGGIVGREFQVNTYTIDDQQNPAISPLSDGGFAIFWESRAQDGSDRGIYGQRYNSAGNPSSSEFRVNTSTDKDQRDPAVVLLNNDNLVVSWHTDGNYSEFGHNIAQIYNSFGGTVGKNYEVTRIGDLPALAPISNGGFTIVQNVMGDCYMIKYGFGGSTCGRLYDDKGNEIYAGHHNMRVTSWTSSYQIPPAVTALNNGDLVVVWQSTGTYGMYGAPGLGIYGQRYNSAHREVGKRFRINTTTAGSQERPVVTSLSDGGFVVVWQNTGHDGTNFGIYGQCYDAVGVMVGSEFQANDHITWPFGEQKMPAITGLSDGGFVITWMRNSSNGGNYNVYAQRYSANMIKPVLTPTATFNPTTALEKDVENQWRRAEL